MPTCGYVLFRDIVSGEIGYDKPCIEIIFFRATTIRPVGMSKRSIRRKS